MYSLSNTYARIYGGVYHDNVVNGTALREKIKAVFYWSKEKIRNFT